jgi:hypothetical protein
MFCDKTYKTNKNELIKQNVAAAQQFSAPEKLTLHFPLPAFAKGTNIQT